MLPKKERENLTQTKLTAKHHMFGATNLRQPKKNYLTAGCHG